MVMIPTILDPVQTHAYGIPLGKEGETGYKNPFNLTPECIVMCDLGLMATLWHAHWSLGIILLPLGFVSTSMQSGVGPDALQGSYNCCKGSMRLYENTCSQYLERMSLKSGGSRTNASILTLKMRWWAALSGIQREKGDPHEIRCEGRELVKGI